jgi:hypothetical protein
MPRVKKLNTGSNSRFAKRQIESSRPREPFMRHQGQERSPYLPDNIAVGDIFTCQYITIPGMESQCAHYRKDVVVYATRKKNGRLVGLELIPAQRDPKTIYKHMLVLDDPRHTTKAFGVNQKIGIEANTIIIVPNLRYHFQLEGFKIKPKGHLPEELLSDIVKYRIASLMYFERKHYPVPGVPDGPDIVRDGVVIEVPFVKSDLPAPDLAGEQMVYTGIKATLDQDRRLNWAIISPDSAQSDLVAKCIDAGLHL